jgi:hypothetical protein
MKQIEDMQDKLEQLSDILWCIDQASYRLRECNNRIAVLKAAETDKSIRFEYIPLFCNMPDELHDREIYSKALRYWLRRYNRELQNITNMPLAVIQPLAIDQTNIPSNVKSLL